MVHESLSSQPGDSGMLRAGSVRGLRVQGALERLLLLAVLWDNRWPDTLAVISGQRLLESQACPSQVVSNAAGPLSPSASSLLSFSSDSARVATAREDSLTAP